MTHWISRFHLEDPAVEAGLVTLTLAVLVLFARDDEKKEKEEPAHESPASRKSWRQLIPWSNLTKTRVGIAGTIFGSLVTLVAAVLAAANADAASRKAIALDIWRKARADRQFAPSVGAATTFYYIDSEELRPYISRLTNVVAALLKGRLKTKANGEFESLDTKNKGDTFAEDTFPIRVSWSNEKITMIELSDPGGALIPRKDRESREAAAYELLAPDFTLNLSGNKGKDLVNYYCGNGWERVPLNGSPWQGSDVRLTFHWDQGRPYVRLDSVQPITNREIVFGGPPQYVDDLDGRILTMSPAHPVPEPIQASTLRAQLAKEQISAGVGLVTNLERYQVLEWPLKAFYQGVLDGKDGGNSFRKPGWELSYSKSLSQGDLHFSERRKPGNQEIGGLSEPPN